MTPPSKDAGFVRMPEEDFEAILARAAEKGARKALADVGLEGPEAAIDIRDLRTLLAMITGELRIIGGRFIFDLIHRPYDRRYLMSKVPMIACSITHRRIFAMLP